MLSEKAKGKQRAVEDGSQVDSRTLTIRFTEGFPDLVLFISGTDTVRDVKAKVRLVLYSESCLMPSLDTCRTSSAEGVASETNSCWPIAHGWYSVASLAEHLGGTPAARQDVSVQ